MYLPDIDEHLVSGFLTFTVNTTVEENIFLVFFRIRYLQQLTGARATQPRFDADDFNR